jgi:predicted secreted acid phosphatase
MQEKASKSQTQELKLELHNVKMMYTLQKETNENLKEWKKQSQEREAKFEVILKQKDAEIEKLKMQLEEYKKMIFKKKKK